MDTEKQKTLGGSFSLFGKGLHTGLNLTVTFNPAPENTGYKIQRIDLEGQPTIEAIAENVGNTERGTVLQQGDVRVSTVEHGMSALYAMGIDNCLINPKGGHRRAECTKRLLYHPQEDRNQGRRERLVHHHPPGYRFLHHGHVLLPFEIHFQPVRHTRQDGELCRRDRSSPYFRLRT